MATYKDEVLADNPHYLFEFEGNTDNTGVQSAYDGTMDGGTVLAPSVTQKGMKAIYFDQSGRLSIPVSAPDFSTNNTTFTFECWAKSDSPTTDYPTMIKRDGGGQAMLMRARGYAISPPKYAEVYMGNGLYQSTKDILDGTWHHVVAVKNGSTTQLWVDGVQVASGAATNSWSYGGGGYFVIGGDDPVERWKGWIVAPAIYNTALSGTRIAAHYNGTDPVVTPPPGPLDLSTGNVGTVTYDGYDTKIARSKSLTTGQMGDLTYTGLGALISIEVPQVPAIMKLDVRMARGIETVILAKSEETAKVPRAYQSITTKENG